MEKNHPVTARSGTPYGFLCAIEYYGLVPPEGELSIDINVVQMMYKISLKQKRRLFMIRINAFNFLFLLVPGTRIELVQG